MDEQKSGSRTPGDPAPVWTRRTMVAAALGTSVVAYAAVRSGMATSSPSPAASDGVTVVDGNAGTASAASTAAAPTTGDFDTLLLRHRNMLTGGNGYTSTAQPYADLLTALDDQVAGYLSTLNTATNRTYLWNDQASGTSSANITSSFVRLRAMAIQWGSIGSVYAGKTTLLDTITQALDWMSTQRYYENASTAGTNWWDWEIGSPMALLDAVAVLGTNLPQATRDRLMAAVDYFTSDPAKGTGANKAWFTRVVLIRSLIVRSGTRFDAARSSLLALMAYSGSGDGFHADGSFIQHDVHPYTGGYGAEMFFQLAWMVFLLGGPTATQVQPADWAIMRTWTTDAFEPFLYRGAISGAVMGRNISRNYYTDHYVGATFLSAVLLLSAVAAAADAPLLRSLFRTQVMYDTARDFFTYDPVTGMGNMTMYIASLGKRTRDDTTILSRDEPNATTIFPDMDRIVHRKPGWSFGVAGFSTRIANYESINGENLHGWYTGAGMAYFFNQYDLAHYQDDYWCTVDPYRLPGTTVDRRTRTDGVAQSSRAQSPMVGGVSDANCGVGVVTIDRDGGSMKARKSWIFIGDYIVCQGSGITNTAGYPVETIVENRNLGATGTNTVQMNAPSTTVLGTSEQVQTLGANWLHLDGVGGYLFPGTNPAIRGLRTLRKGAWSDVNGASKTPTDTRSRRYVTLWLDHGSTASNATYGYVFLPNAGAADTGSAWTNNQVQRQTTTAAHYARGLFSSLDVHGAAFWEPAAIGIFTADAPVTVIVRVTNGRISITVSDPTQLRTAPINVRVDLPNSGILSRNDSVQVSRTATSATITFSPSGMKGQGGRAVLSA